MAYVNLFPAILLAGPPNTGKSVFAYHCSIKLKKHKTPFIILRTTPDGEGDWFMESTKAVSVALRQHHKGHFTPQLVHQAETAILHRKLPMLVDIGGKPRGEQFRILHACTHAILLYRTETEKTQWQAWLDETGLIPIAWLRSDLTGSDTITTQEGPLQGVISGLDRFQPRLGPTFDKVMARIHGIFDYPPSVIQERHLRNAPAEAHTIVVEHLARSLKIPQDHRGYWWSPAHLPQAIKRLPKNSAIALYGRGTAWLYASIAAHNHPYPFHLFDARHFGWMQPPPVILNSTQTTPDIDISHQMQQQELRLKLTLQTRFITPAPIHLPPLPPAQAIILDGKMPLWLSSALTRALLPAYPRILLYDPRTKENIQVWPLAPA